MGCKSHTSEVIYEIQNWMVKNIQISFFIEGSETHLRTKVHQQKWEMKCMTCNLVRGLEDRHPYHHASCQEATGTNSGHSANLAQLLLPSFGLNRKTFQHEE